MSNLGSWVSTHTTVRASIRPAGASRGKVAVRPVGDHVVRGEEAILAGKGRPGIAHRDVVAQQLGPPAAVRRRSRWHRRSACRAAGKRLSTSRVMAPLLGFLGSERHRSLRSGRAGPWPATAAHAGPVVRAGPRPRGSRRPVRRQEEPPVRREISGGRNAPDRERRRRLPRRRTPADDRAMRTPPAAASSAAVQPARSRPAGPVLAAGCGLPARRRR